MFGRRPLIVPVLLASIVFIGAAYSQATNEYEYDALGRLKRVDHSSGEGIEYTYDEAGNRDQVAVEVPDFSVADDSSEEGDVVSFVVTRSGNEHPATSVDYATSTGTASGSDFTAASGTLSFAADETSKNINVSTTEDTDPESDETFTLTLSNPAGGATIDDGSATGTILNDDSTPPSFSIADTSISEGGTLSFTVTKSTTASQTHNVNYATANGTATAGSDYTSKSGALSFGPSELTKYVTVSTTQDSTYESAETVLVNLSGATGGATITDSQGQGTITNDDSGPSFSVNDNWYDEGGNLTFTVTKTGSTALSHNVNYWTQSGSAEASDYTATSGTLTFTSGQTQKTVYVATVEDSIFEPTESVYLKLGSATNSATISDNHGHGGILDDDPAPSFSIGNSTVSEGNTLQFTVWKTGSTEFTHNVNYATANGTAAAGSDYTSKSGTLSFASANMSQAITVSTIEDTNVEANETMYVNLSSPTNTATISDGQGLGTINNDDVSNSPPNAVNDFSGISGTSVYIPVLNNDSDPNEGTGDTFSVTSVTTPIYDGGTAQIVGGGTEVLFTKPASPPTFGCAQFNYTITDSFGATDTATVQVTWGALCE